MYCLNEKEREAAFGRLSEELSSRGFNGAALSESMRNYLGIYKKEILAWAASLFDPASGGFYFSISGRDNPGFGADVESTSQALNILFASGAVRDADCLPRALREKIASFVCSLQSDSDGYFYHRQWGSKVTPSRRARDLGWAVGLSKRLGFTLPYATAYERLNDSKKDNSSAKAEGQPEHFKSEAAYLKYLAALPFGESGTRGAYGAANTVAADARLIEAAGYTDAVVGYLNRIQGENGLWGPDEGYMLNNAFMKVSCLYDTVKRPLPRASLAAESIMELLATDEVPRTVCYHYNVWFSLLNIVANLRRFGGAEGRAEADGIVKSILSRLADLLSATAEKNLLFRKSDGSFSCLIGSTTYISQGMPVAVEGTDEGDFNATNICSVGTAVRINALLGIPDEKSVPIFTAEDFRNYFIPNLRL